jgi:hypothetical protein
MTAIPRRVAPAAPAPDYMTGQNYEWSQMYEMKKYLARFRRGPR